MADFDVCMGTGDYPTNDFDDEIPRKHFETQRGFDFVNGELICRKCGSRMVTVHPGMMTDRAWCNNCGNEDYI